MSKFLLLLLFVSTSSFAIPRLEWRGEVQGIKKIKRQKILEVKTKTADIEVILDCQGPTQNLAVIKERRNKSVVLSDSECKKIYKKLENWSSNDKEYTLEIDSFQDSVISKE